MHKTWSTITSVLQTLQNKNKNKVIIFKNIEITDEFDITQLYNNFFTGFATDLDSNIPASVIDPLNLMSLVDASLFIYPISVKKCTQVIDNLKLTKTGFIQLPVKFYKFLKNVISPVIDYIANCCFYNGFFPDHLKFAVVTPKFRKGDKKNYPITDQLPTYLIFLKQLKNLIMHISKTSF